MFQLTFKMHMVLALRQSLEKLVHLTLTHLALYTR